MTKELFCSPSIDSVGKTCYSKKDMIFLIKSYNRNKKTKHQIEIGKKEKNILWEELNNKLQKDCNNEWCWLEQDFVPAPYAKQKIKETFKPETPEEWNKNPFEWLSSDDIRNVMKQYEKKYPSFLFIGPVPVDCPSSITCTLSGLDVNILINRLGKTKLGIIYNLDKHDEPGSHWVSCFFDFKKCRILYFDSVGLPPPKMILNFLIKMKESCQDYYLKTFGKEKKGEIYANTTKFQFGNSECGVFSLHFIISNLKGDNIHEMKKENINDKVMNDLRKKYYRPN
jgi:hypothetical protein